MFFLPLYHDTFGTALAVDALVSRLVLSFHQAYAMK
jgi:hypothetical protein